MSRIGFCVCGFQDPTDPTQAPPTLDPLNCWLWLPTPQTDTVPGTDFPFSYSSDDGVLLAWRIQEITLIYDLTVTPDMDPPTNYNGNLVGQLMNNIGSPITDEKDLVRGFGDFFFQLVDSNMELNIFPDVLVQDPTTKSLYLETSFLALGVLILFSTDPTLATAISVTSSSIPSLNGITVYTDGGDPTPYSGTISIEASNWFAYDNGQPGGPPNGPIWDTATGVQLITPVPGGI